MSALALFAASAGIQTAVGVKQAFDAQAQAQLSSAGIALKMEEIEQRSKIQISNIWKSSEKVESSQKAAFISGGVELTGSAMSVVSDTINNAAMSAYIRQRETDYEMMSATMEKSQYDQMGSNETMLLNVGAAGLGGAASFMSSMANYQQSSVRKHGSTGIDDGQGGAYTTNYSSGSGTARGIS